MQAPARFRLEVDSDLIREVYVSLENFNISSEKTLDEILPVIATYMPYEVMDEYYEFNYSCSYEPDEGKEVTDKYYVVSYALTDEAKEDYYKKEHECPPAPLGVLEHFLELGPLIVGAGYCPVGVDLDHPQVVIPGVVLTFLDLLLNRYWTGLPVTVTIPPPTSTGSSVTGSG